MLISIVIPVLNEEGSLKQNIRIIQTVLPTVKNCEFEIILVDDGSEDNTLKFINELAENDDSIKYLRFTRNFGKEAAMLAGLEYSRGDAAIVMDSDLQHPPELIPEMIEFYTQGYMVVNARKRTRGSENWVYKKSTQFFYWMFSSLTNMELQGHSDYKLLDRSVIEAYCKLPERIRFFRAAIQYLGYQSKDIYFDVDNRDSGSSSWTTLRLMRYALLGLTNYTSFPLHLVSIASFVVFVASIVLSFIALYHYFTGVALEGFTTVIILQLFIGSVIMFALGQIGIYLERIFDEVMRRPIYVIDARRSSKFDNKG